MNNIVNNLLGIYEKGIPLQYSWPEKFAIAKDAGFDFIEFSIDGLKPRIDRLEDSDDYYHNIYNLSLEYGMPFKTMALTANRYFPLGDPELSLKGFKIVERAIEIAEILHIEIIQIATYDVYKKDSNSKTIERLFENLVALSDIANKKGIILAPEVLEDVPFFDSVKKASKIIQTINRPNLKLYADCGNTASIGIDNEDDLKSDDGIIKCLHVKDALIGNCRNVPYGTGIVDFKKVLNHFNNINYKGYFVAEVWSDEDTSFVPTLKDVASFIRKEIKYVDK